MKKGRGKHRCLSLAATCFLLLSFIPAAKTAKAETVNWTKADIVFTSGTTAVDSTNFQKDLMDAIQAKGIDTNRIAFTNFSQETVNTQDNFAWQTYDHLNVWENEDPYPDPDSAFSRKQHIIVKNNGQNLTFYGYGISAYKDFMFMTNNIESKKTFTFELDETHINYHSMQGGGFLFNSTIESNGTLKGYVLLYSSYGLELYEVTGLNADAFHNERSNSLASLANQSGSGVKLLKTFEKGNQGKHTIKFEATPEKIDMWDNGNKIIDNYALINKYGNGFGPIASYNPHDCNILSYFTFDNLKMSYGLMMSLKDVVNKAKWNIKSVRYIINLDDALINDFDDPTVCNDILANMTANKVNYIGWGTEVNKSQAEGFIQKNNNNGLFLMNKDYTTSVQKMADVVSEALYKADIADDKALLGLGYSKGDTAANVNKNITLPQAGPYASTITWSSSNKGIVADNGTVTRTADMQDTTVVLTATINKGGFSDTKQFTIVVKKPAVLVQTGSVFDFNVLAAVGLISVACGIFFIKRRIAE